MNPQSNYIYPKYDGRSIELDELELKSACVLVREAMLDEYNHEIIPHTFSDRFNRKMDVLIKSIHKKASIKKLSQVAASFILIILLFGSMVFCVNAEARSKFLNWIVSITNSVITFDNSEINNTEESINSISVTIMEDELFFDLLAETEDAKVYSIDYSGESILLICQYGGDIINIFTPDNQLISTSVNGQPADFYNVIGGDGTNELFWTDEMTGLLLNLSGKLSQEEMTQLAEKIEIQIVSY